MNFQSWLILWRRNNDGENVYITASTIRNQTIIEKNSMVGMGSVVTKNIGENQVVVGMPSKKIRDRY